MVAREGQNLLIVILAIINSLLSMIGIAIVGLAISAIVQTKDQAHGTIYTILTVGVILFLSGICGCVAACSQSRSCLCLFSVGMVLLMLVTLTFAVLFLVKSKENSALSKWQHKMGKDAQKMSKAKDKSNVTYQSYTLVLGLVSMGTAVVELCAIVFSCCLYHGLDRELSPEDGYIDDDYKEPDMPPSRYAREQPDMRPAARYPQPPPRFPRRYESYEY